MNANSKPKALNNNISIRSWLTQATVQLKTAGIASAQLDAELLLADALHVDRTWLYAHDGELIPADTAQHTLQRRLYREPLAYIRGWQEFYGRRFTVTPNVLIPRPESETLIEFLKHLPSSATAGKLVDVGTGSGCLGITAALEHPSLTVMLSDVSEQALAVARQNLAAYPQLSERVTFTRSHLLEDIAVTPSIIIANLPYVGSDWQRSIETDYEPSLALFAEDDGLALIKQLIAQAATRLPSQGYLLLEADTRQMEAIQQFASSHNFTVKRQHNFGIMLQLQKD